MKKLTVLVLSITFSSLVYSQNDSLLRSKKGKVILPQAGNFALGIAANPFFNYAGNLFSNSGDNSLNVSLLGGNQLFFKYFLKDNCDIRVRFSITRNSKRIENSGVPDDLNPNTTLKVTDIFNETTSTQFYALGYEKRKGSGRLQLHYGVEVGFNYSTLVDTYTYSNSFSSSNVRPNSSIFSSGSSSYGPTSSRTLKSKQPNMYSYNGRAFVGVEYFFFPKICIGAEMGMTYSITPTYKSTVVTESWNSTTRSAQQSTSVVKNGGNYVSNDIFGGQIFLIFHF